MRSEPSQKLASLEEVLTIDQVKSQLQAIVNSNRNELMTKERAAKMIQVSQVWANPCTEATFSNLSQFLDDYRAFPNLRNYLNHYQAEQLRQCPQYLNPPPVEPQPTVPASGADSSPGKRGWKSKFTSRFHRN